MRAPGCAARTARRPCSLTHSLSLVSAPLLQHKSKPPSPLPPNRRSPIRTQALIESARSLANAADGRRSPRERGAGLGAVTLHLPLAPPFWKVLLGLQITIRDLADLDPAEHASLGALLGAPLEEGTIFETFEMGGGSGGGGGGGEISEAAAAGGGGGGAVRLVPAGPYKKVGEG